MYVYIYISIRKFMHTSIFLPSTTVPCSLSRARSASALFANVTKPNPCMQGQTKQHALNSTYRLPALRKKPTGWADISSCVRECASEQMRARARPHARENRRAYASSSMYTIYMSVGRIRVDMLWSREDRAFRVGRDANRCASPSISLHLCKIKRKSLFADARGTFQGRRGDTRIIRSRFLFSRSTRVTRISSSSRRRSDASPN